MSGAGMGRILPVLDDDATVRAGAVEDRPPGLGALVTGRGNLPLEALAVRARISGLVASTVLTQTFVNHFDLPLEATYVFPLPDRAAVTSFRMEIGERVIEGALRERAEARAAYDQALAAGRLASIAEEDRPGVFTMRVGNLPAGERTTVRLELLGPLPYDHGEATFRFPLVVAPRYIPGQPLGWPPAGDGVQPDTDAVPDASRITPPVLLPGFPSPVSLELEAEIDPAGLPLEAVTSSLHAVVTGEREGPGGRVRVIQARPGARADRDFVLRLRLGSGGLDTAARAVPDERGDGGTFALTVLPPPAGAARPRDVALVLDRSGSMAGWKIVAARRAAARMVDSLSERDRLTLLAFDGDLASPWPDSALRPASDRERFRAVEFLARLDARGGTEMAAPLQQALDRLGAAEPGRDRVLVLVTDGQVGNEDQILRLLAPRLGGVRIYTVGVDTAVNEGFLRRLAVLGGGACELVESEDRLDEALDRVRQRIGTPVLADLELVPQGLDVVPDTVAPARLPALLAGAPLTVHGRYRGAPGGALTLRGRRPGGEPWQTTVPLTPAGDASLAKVWARAHLRDLEDRYAAGAAHDAELERRIVATSLEFGVLSRFTAFVALDTVVVERDGRLHRVTQPVDLPHGWEPPGLEPAAVPMGPVARARGGLLSADAPAAMPSVRPQPAMPRPVFPPKQPLRPQPPGAGRRFWRALPEAGTIGAPTGTGAELTAEDGLAAYRRRAAELARDLEATPEAALADRLGAAPAELAGLASDLRSVGAEPGWVARLLALAAELGGLAVTPGAGAERLRDLRDRVVAALAELAEEPS
jgi:Ca-activated chloride channel family protein